MPSIKTTVPSNIYVSQEDWDTINDEQKQFLVDAASVSMAHLVQDGEVIAWGPGLAHFSMIVHTKPHHLDGWVVTLP